MLDIVKRTLKGIVILIVVFLVITIALYNNEIEEWIGLIFCKFIVWLGT